MLKIDKTAKKFVPLDAVAPGSLAGRLDLSEYIANSPSEFFGEIGQKVLVLGRKVRPTPERADRRRSAGTRLERTGGRRRAAEQQRAVAAGARHRRRRPDRQLEARGFLRGHVGAARRRAGRFARSQSRPGQPQAARGSDRRVLRFRSAGRHALVAREVRHGPDVRARRADGRPAQQHRISDLHESVRARAASRTAERGRGKARGGSGARRTPQVQPQQESIAPITCVSTTRAARWAPSSSISAKAASDWKCSARCRWAPP